MGRSRALPDPNAPSQTPQANPAIQSANGGPAHPHHREPAATISQTQPVRGVDSAPGINTAAGTGDSAGINAPRSPGTDPAPPVAAPATASQPSASSSLLPTPAAQIVPVFATLTQSATGTQQVTVRLHPAELGMVQITIDKAPGGHALVSISADRAATLQALQGDQVALHHALDLAGITSTGRTVTFHEVHIPPAETQTATQAGNQTGNPSSQNQNRQSHANLGPGGNNAESGSSQGDGQPPRPASLRWQQVRPEAARGSAATPSRLSPRTRRIGLDITA